MGGVVRRWHGQDGVTDGEWCVRTRPANMTIESERQQESQIWLIWLILVGAIQAGCWHFR